MSTPTPAPEDVGLPADVWTEIALDSDPLDVLSLAQVSKAFHSLLSQKYIWKAVLQGVTQRNGPLIVSYSLDDLTVDALQKAATQQERWKKLCRRKLTSASECMQSTLMVATRAKMCPSSLMPVNSKDIYRFVPGGRFLLHVAVVVVNTLISGSNVLSSSATVTLWDMGPQSCILSVQPIPLASHLLASGLGLLFNLFDLGIDVGVSGATQLTLVATFTRTNKEMRSGIVLELSLGSQERTFNIVSNIEYQAQPNGNQPPLISGTHILLPILRSCLLWNYVTSQICHWSDPSGYKGAFKSTWITDHYVVTTMDRGVQVWDISKMGGYFEAKMGPKKAPSVEPHLFMATNWPSIPDLCSVTHPRVQVLDAVNSSTSILFEFVTHTMMEVITGPHFGVFRYQLTLTKQEGTNMVEGVLLLNGGGQLATPGMRPADFPQPEPGLCWKADAQEDFFRFYSYHPAELESWSDDLPHDAAHAAPLALVPLGFGQPLVSCPMSGRVIYDARKRGATFGQADDMICADYIP